eukprot:1184283-Prorocentrum_minimum.AAC.1
MPTTWPNDARGEGICRKCGPMARDPPSGGLVLAATYFYPALIVYLHRGVAVEVPNNGTRPSGLMGSSCYTSPGVDCQPANGSLSAGNIRRIFRGIFEMPCAEWYTSVELKSKAFLAVDSRACCYNT